MVLFQRLKFILIYKSISRNNKSIEMRATVELASTFMLITFVIFL